MASTLEDMIGNGMGQIVGDPAITGLLFLVFFFGFVLIQPSRLDHKVAILIPATILSLVFIPFLSVLFAIVAGFLLYRAIVGMMRG